MTFAQIVQAICDHCNLTSGEAQTRVGKAVNRHHKRITSSLGLDASRFVTRSATTTLGVQTVTFSEIEKIDRVIDTTDSTAIRLLEEVSLHEIRANQPGNGQPDVWAMQNTDADAVTIRLDTVPQASYSLQADGWTTLADLSGTDEPVIPESFHDILVFFGIAEEQLKKEKDKLAGAFEQKAEKLLSDLRFQLADSPTKDTRQGDGVRGASGSGGTGGGGGNSGGTSYTQSGLLTFDRGNGVAPFAVASSTAAVVTNLDADKLDGSHLAQVITAATLAAEAAIIPVDVSSEVTGRLPYANLVQATTPNILVGRRSGSTGDLEQISLGTGLSMSSTTLNADPTIPSGASSEVQFRNGGSFGGDTAFTFNSATDTLTVPIVDVSAAAGGQVKFPATQNPSINANTLDDYEEGSWTITIIGTSGSGQTYSGQAGRYQKVGNKVFVTGRVSLTSLGTASGVASIGNLPFTVENTTPNYTGTFHIGYWSAFTDSYVYMSALPVNNTTRAELYGAGASATSMSQVTIANMSGTTDLIFSGTYLASA